MILGTYFRRFALHKIGNPRRGTGRWKGGWEKEPPARSATTGRAPRGTADLRSVAHGRVAEEAEPVHRPRRSPVRRRAPRLPAQGSSRAHRGQAHGPLACRDAPTALGVGGARPVTRRPQRDQPVAAGARRAPDRLLPPAGNAARLGRLWPRAPLRAQRLRLPRRAGVRPAPRRLTTKTSQN